MIPRKETNLLIIHCSDTLSGNAAAIRSYHMNQPPLGRGWSDIGYHFVIDLDGTIEPGRAENLIGSHCEGENWNSIGICLIGQKSFNDSQFEALRNLANSLLNKYGLTADNVFGHYEFDSAKRQGKSCPNLTTSFIRNLIKGDL